MHLQLSLRALRITLLKSLDNLRAQIPQHPSQKLETKCSITE